MDRHPLGGLTNFAALGVSCAVGWPSLQTRGTLLVYDSPLPSQDSRSKAIYVESPRDIPIDRSGNHLSSGFGVQELLDKSGTAASLRDGGFVLPAVGSAPEGPSRLCIPLDDRCSFFSSSASLGSFYLRLKDHTLPRAVLTVLGVRGHGLPERGNCFWPRRAEKRWQCFFTAWRFASSCESTSKSRSTGGAPRFVSSPRRWRRTPSYGPYCRGCQALVLSVALFQSKYATRFERDDPFVGLQQTRRAQM